jgi:hypothetical protein
MRTSSPQAGLLILLCHIYLTFLRVELVFLLFLLGYERPGIVHSECINPTNGFKN